MPKRYFTLERAQRQLGRVKKHVLRLQNVKRGIDTLASIKIDPDEFEFDEIVETTTKLSKDYYKLLYEFYKELEKLESIGCILKDVEIGLVDFYSRLDGRDIFLCWKLGEEKIQAWHEIDEGLADRHPVIDLEELQK